MRQQVVDRSPLPSPRRAQRGFTLLGLLFWGTLLGVVTVVGLRILPTVQEYWTIQRLVRKVAQEGGPTVAEIRFAFDRQKQVHSSISALSGRDLEITKRNDQVVVHFAYDKEVPLFGPTFLLIKYKGSSQ